MTSPFKRYCLLENLTIEPCYYDKKMTEIRHFDYDNGKWYLSHDVFGNGCCLSFYHKVLKFADTKKELKDYAKRLK